MHTIAAIATPPGIGAIGMVRLSGPDSLRIVQKLFFPVRRMDQWEPHVAYVGECREESETLDQVVVTYYKGPRSYTGEDLIEITCHGGRLVLQKILEACFHQGAQHAGPGEFTERAFLSGKLDLLQAEAVLDIIHADSERALETAQDLLKGNLTHFVNDLKRELIDIASGIEAEIEFPDESDVQNNLPALREGRQQQLSEILERVQPILDTYDQGLHLREGYTLPLLGAPNTGKSTLMNSLMGFERSLISTEPGTTRDYISERVFIQGFPVTLIDMAGVRHTDCHIEQQGILQGKNVLAQAELALFLVDASRPLSEDDSLALNLCPSGVPKLVLLNKMDLEPCVLATDPLFKNHPVIPISAREGTGITELRQVIAESLHVQALPRKETLILTHGRHKNSLERCRDACQKALGLLDAVEGQAECVVFELRDALKELQVLTGEITVEDILSHIFTNFCIGK